MLLIVSLKRWSKLKLTIIFTVVLGAITLYAVTDMIVYNKRKVTQLNLEKQKRNELALAAALTAVRTGTANIKQRVLVKRYEMVKEAEDERIRNRGPIAKAAEWVAPGILGRQSEARLVMRLDDDIIKSIESGELPRFLDEVQEEQGNKDVVEAKVASTTLSGPGSLDRDAESAVSSVKRWLKWPWS